MKVALDIGGVISKYPDTFRELARALMAGGVEVHIITDMIDRRRALEFLAMNGFDFIPAERVHNGDYRAHGELCKAAVLRDQRIDVMVDDFPGYLTEGCPVRLLLQPDPRRPYYAPEWKTDGSEGGFGRQVPAGGAEEGGGRAK